LIHRLGDNMDHLRHLATESKLMPRRALEVRPFFASKAESRSPFLAFRGYDAVFACGRWQSETESGHTVANAPKRPIGTVVLARKPLSSSAFSWSSGRRPYIAKVQLPHDPYGPDCSIHRRSSATGDHGRRDHTESSQGHKAGGSFRRRKREESRL
jgi:hypothetical protein